MRELAKLRRSIDSDSTSNLPIHAVFCAQDAPGNFAGGPNAWLQRLLPDLVKEGITVTTLIIGSGIPDECPLVAALRAKGVPVRFLDSKLNLNRFLEQKLRWIVRQLNELKPSIFVPNLVIPAYFAAGWARNAGLPSIGVIHSNDAFHDHLLDTFVYGRSKRQISAVVAVSDYLETCIAKKNYQGVLLQKIPYGVPLPEKNIRPSAEVLRVAYVGRFRQEQKRILDVTESFCNASKLLPNAVFTLLGNGPEKQGMAKIIEAHDVGHAVLIQDPLPPSRVQDFMQSQDVFVLLSDYEGLPIALQEAMATGMVPVCLREESGVNELIRHGENGFIVADRGGDFHAALYKLDANRDLLDRLSLGARETIESRYSSERQHDKWSALLREVAEIGPKHRIRLPLFVDLPAPHPSFRGEDRLSPSYWERGRNALRAWATGVRLAIRPRARIREVWQDLTNRL